MHNTFQNSYSFAIYKTINVMRVIRCRGGFTPADFVLFFLLVVHTNFKMRHIHPIYCTFALNCLL